MPITHIDQTQFLLEAVTTINDNFDTLSTQVAGTMASVLDSGLTPPILLSQGVDNQHWLLPAGVTSLGVIVSDHGLILRADQYSVANGIVILNYVPSATYAIDACWSTTKTGITTPLALVNNTVLGPLYWTLNSDTGSNVLVLDHGRILDRSQYAVTDSNVVLNYNPATPWDIAAAWGRGGPGMPAPVPCTQQVAGDALHWLLPSGFGKTIQVFDIGALYQW